MRFLTFGLLLLLQLNTGCSHSGNAVKLPPAGFAKELSEASDAQLIDVRTPEEFAGGHLPHALNINYNSPDFKTRIAQLDKNKPVFVYCAVGGRSGKSAELMSGMGFDKIIDMQGGVNAWTAAGQPLEK